MDLLKVLAELHEERRRLKLMIARLEAMQDHKGHVRGRRAPKGMSSAGRQAASERMKLYWATRKRKEAATAEATEAQPVTSSEPASGMLKERVGD